MEFFYRELRRKHRVLMDADEPAGGAWNFDAENREAFGKNGPADAETPLGFAPDATTREVLTLVQDRFAKHPGSLARFDWPVNPDQARAARLRAALGIRSRAQHRTAPAKNGVDYDSVSLEILTPYPL